MANNNDYRAIHSLSLAVYTRVCLIGRTDYCVIIEYTYINVSRNSLFSRRTIINCCYCLKRLRRSIMQVLTTFELWDVSPRARVTDRNDNVIRRGGRCCTSAGMTRSETTTTTTTGLRQSARERSHISSPTYAKNDF